MPVLLVKAETTADELLSQYVHETLASDDNDWFGYREAPWEDKLHAVTAIIADQDVSGRACVDVALLKSLYVNYNNISSDYSYRKLYKYY